MAESSFLALLETKGVVAKADIDSLNRRLKGDVAAIRDHLVRTQAAPAGTIAKLWGDSIGVAAVDMDKTLFQSTVVAKLPQALAQKYQAIPLYQLGEAVTVAMANPRNQVALQEIQRAIGDPVSPVFSLPETIVDAIDVQYQSSGALTKMAQDQAFPTTMTADQVAGLANEKTVVDFVRGLLLLAVQERASDIHLEPQTETLRVRFRIDGVLQEKMSIDAAVQRPLVSRLKIMADLDITERRRPLDGRISLPLTNRSLDFRLSTVPTVNGEKIVLRVLGQVQNRDVPELEELNLSHKNLNNLKKVIATPNGVFFVTGPTGSGKTTTLFSVMKRINTSAVNIMTAEDPVEYRLPGINQVQVNPAVGLTFAAALRSFLRQDPNVILIGEIRDMETAKIASQAALTGHLVLATMHTNNALQAVTRLIEIGVEPFLVAPSIIGVMAQRLVRRLCTYCREKYRLSTEQAEKYFILKQTREVQAYRAKGCPECRGSGYAGRLAIHELFIMTEHIRSMVGQGASILEIEKQAHQGGFQTMRYDGFKKVLRGLTTFEEIEKATEAGEE